MLFYIFFSTPYPMTMDVKKITFSLSHSSAPYLIPNLAYLFIFSSYSPFSPSRLSLSFSYLHRARANNLFLLHIAAPSALLLCVTKFFLVFTSSSKPNAHINLLILWILFLYLSIISFDEAKCGRREREREKKTFWWNCLTIQQHKRRRWRRRVFCERREIKEGCERKELHVLELGKLFGIKWRQGRIKMRKNQMKNCKV